jgi:hypothetical protein
MHATDRQREDRPIGATTKPTGGAIKPTEGRFAHARQLLVRLSQE